MNARALKTEEYRITEEPYYAPQGGEITLFEAAYKNQLPVLLKGPTGCGKTRSMEHMAWRLKRPLITVSCHDDLTASDLVGRYLITAGETVWVDGPMARWRAPCAPARSCISTRSSRRARTPPW